MQTGLRAPIEDLDSLPYPDYEGFEYGKLLDKSVHDILGIGKERLGYVSLSRSCPFNCSFCFHPTGAKYRKRNMKKVFEEIDYLIEKFSINNLTIEDELFVAKENDLIDFCSEIKKRRINFSAQLRVDMVNRQKLQMLKDSGCVSIGFGLESADNRILNSMNKHITIEQIENALALCYELGLNVVGNFIFGDIAETKETYNTTLKWWHEHPQYPIMLHPIIVYPGSEIYKYACKEGIITDKVEFIKQGCPLTNVSQLSDNEYKEMLLTISMETKRSELIDNAHVVYTGSNKAELTGACPYCGKENKWERLDVFRNLKLVSCSNCKHPLYLIPSNFIDNLASNNFKKLKGHKIGIWPMINSVNELCRCIPEIKDDGDVYFIDSSKMKQNVAYKGKVINSPAIINSNKLDTIIITTSASFIVSDIMQNIMKCYPTVKYVLFVGDLIDKEFSLEKSNIL